MTEVASFSIDYLQILNQQSELTQALPSFAEQEGFLEKCYRIMSLTRAYDSKAIALQRTGKMGTYASILGQEAISTAIGLAMQPDDVLTPYYRDYAAQRLRGVSMEEIYAYWGGDERGSCFQNNQHDFPISVPIASQCLHASGVAYAFKLRGQKRVAVATIGEGGTSEGDFYEAINAAGNWKLPAVFVVNNNQWAISVPRNIQTAAETIAQKAIAAGFTGRQVDGNDIIALHQVISEAIEKARNGGGPTLIEALTYRLCDHTTADDATRYQDAAELKAAWQHEPIIRLQRYLRQQNLWDDAKQAELDAECKKEVDATVDAYLSREKQSFASTFDFHYENMPHSLQQQKQQALKD